MKRIFTILMAVMLVLSFAACSSNGGNTNTETTPTTAATEATAEHFDALEVLTTVWAAYPEDNKFPVGGGDFSEENMSFEGPGKHSIEGEDNIANLTSSFQFPEAELSKINNAATLMHGMMVNNFACGAYNVTNADDVAAVVEAIKENIENAEWICGFPEGYVIVTLGDCVISYYGLADNTKNFTDALTASYADAVVIYEEAIVA